MFKYHLHPADQPLFSRDLDICQRVFDIVRREFAIERATSQNDLIASQIIALYKRGIEDEEQLLTLVRASSADLVARQPFITPQSDIPRGMLKFRCGE